MTAGSMLYDFLSKVSWKFLAGLTVCFLASGCATQTVIWKAASIAESPLQQIPLYSKDKETIDYIDRHTVQKLLEIKDRIESVAGASRAELLITTGEKPNAFAGPSKLGPIVGINLPMIRLLGSDWDAYAAIMGHEYAHLTLNHSGIRQEREQMRQGASSILGAILGAAGVPLGGTLANIATTAVTTVYSREEEREADSAGLQYAARAGYDPQGAVRVWQRMTGISGFSIPFLNTHPSSTERIDNLRQLVAGMSAAPASSNLASSTSIAPARSSTPRGSETQDQDRSGQIEQQATLMSARSSPGRIEHPSSETTPKTARYPDLMTAVMNSDKDDVNYYLSRGADLNQRTGGSTYLIAAIINNDLEMVKFLVSKGADVSKMDERGLTPMAYALATRHINPELIRYLEDFGAQNPFTARQ